VLLEEKEYYYDVPKVVIIIQKWVDGLTTTAILFSSLLELGIGPFSAGNAVFVCLMLDLSTQHPEILPISCAILLFDKRNCFYLLGLSLSKKTF
jgi:hypothetical protein